LKVASHDLRSTFATEAWEASGHDTVAVQRLMGHARFETTVGYTSTSPERLREAVDFQKVGT
jgi:site-specific recombinase XerD